MSSFRHGASHGRRLRIKHPDRLPVVCIKDTSCALPDLEKQKILVPSRMLVHDFQELIYRKLQEIARGPDTLINTTIYLYVLQGRICIKDLHCTPLSELFTLGEADDGCLHITYSSEILHRAHDAPQEEHVLLQVLVHQLSGKEFELLTSRSFTVAAFKDQVARCSGVPLEFQQLALGSTILGDSAIMGSFCNEGNAAISLSLSIKMPTPSGLKQIDRHILVGALEAFACTGARDSEAATMLAKICLEDTNFQVRMKALNVLGKVVNRGDHDVIILVAGCLDDEADEVRREAVNSLRLLGAPDDQHVASMIRPFLDHPAKRVRRSAMWTLEAIARKR